MSVVLSVRRVSPQTCGSVWSDVQSCSCNHYCPPAPLLSDWPPSLTRHSPRPLTQRHPRALSGCSSADRQTDRGWRKRRHQCLKTTHCTQVITAWSQPFNPKLHEVHSWHVTTAMKHQRQHQTSISHWPQMPRSNHTYIILPGFNITSLLKRKRFVHSAVYLTHLPPPLWTHSWKEREGGLE